MHRAYYHAFAGLGILLGLLLPDVGLSQSRQVRLVNGLTLEGGILELSSINADPFSAASKSEVETRPIWLIDNGLKRVYVYQHELVESHQPADAIAKAKISLWQPVGDGGRNVVVAGSVLKKSPFNSMGRREIQIQSEVGAVPVIQGVSELTAVYARLDSLKGTNLVWDMRMATTSIPPNELRTMLDGTLAGPDDLQGRLNLVRFYYELEYFDDAIREIDAAIPYAPDPAGLKLQRRTLLQEQANQLLKEVMLREKAGQRRLALQILDEFPKTGVAEEIKIRLEETTNRIRNEIDTGNKLCDQLAAQLTELGANNRAGFDTLVKEIRAEISPDTLPRLDDYQRLGAEASLPLENRIALGLGGWLLGPGAGMQNLAVVKSLIDVRAKVAEYLVAPNAERRAAILTEIRALENSSPLYIAKILSLLPPPISDSGQFADAQVPGMFRIPVPLGATGEQTEYVVQLPPEYNPLRKYPCIVALHPMRRAPEWQINWWAGPWGGPYSQKYQMREGQATRHGYIVLAPNWSDGVSYQFQYTGREHHQVLAALRDAMRRFSIDTDAVYLTGHGEGSSAAWDLAGAHPDLWAGLIAIGGEARKYVLHYSENLKNLPMYFVFGEISGPENPLVRNGGVWDRYMSRGFECMLVSYKGRGDEDFFEEQPLFFDWMSHPKQRRRPPHVTCRFACCAGPTTSFGMWKHSS